MHWLSKIILLVILFITSSVHSQNIDSIVIDSLQKKLTITSNKDEQVKILAALTEKYLYINPEQGNKYGKKALEISLNDSVKAKIVSSMANNYLMISNFKEALSHYEEALQIYIDNGDTESEAKVTGNLGFYYFYLGDYGKSMDNQYKALKIFESLDNKLGQANTLLALSSLFREQKHFEKSMEHSKAALKLFEGLNDELGIASTKTIVANAYLALNKDELAIQSFTEANNIFSKFGNKINIAENMLLMSDVDRKKGNYQKAIATIKEAEIMFEEYGSSHGISRSNFLIGNIYYLNSDKEKSFSSKAISHLEKSIEIAKSINFLEGIEKPAEILSQIYAKQGKDKLAYQYLKLYIESHDTLAANETKIKIQNLTTQREIELKNKQIELDRLAVAKKRNERGYFIAGLIFLLLTSSLIYRNFKTQKSLNTNLESTLETLKSTQTQLVETEKQKQVAETRARISQDIHDDISSGLTKISWLVEMMKVSKISQTNADDNNLLDKINSYSKDTVSKLSEIIWSTNPQQDTINGLLSFMRTHINKYLQDTGIDFKIDFPDFEQDYPIGPEIKRNLFLVLKESLHNAVKYSKANLINIKFLIEQNSYELMISDNGKGFEQGTLSGTGYGLSGMEKRMKSINGTLEIQSIINKGTSLIFRGLIA